MDSAVTAVNAAALRAAGLCAAAASLPPASPVVVRLLRCPMHGDTLLLAVGPQPQPPPGRRGGNGGSSCSELLRPVGALAAKRAAQLITGSPALAAADSRLGEAAATLEVGRGLPRHTRKPGEGEGRRANVAQAQQSCAIARGRPDARCL
jgi:hypothetical protein